MIEIAALFVSTLAALSSMVQAVKTARELSDDDVSRAETIAKPDLKNHSAQALAASGIDPEYIEIALQNIQRAIKRFKGVWKDPGSPQAVKDQEQDAADFVVCSELRRLKRLNGGELPGHDQFYALWDVHQCEASQT